jgi:DNA-directed RNA polymerase specialized sigma24 family protein
MPAPLRILLTSEEDRTLSELREAQKLPQRIRDRAHMLRLNALGWNVPEIAEIFECHQHTVRATLRRWQEQGLYIFFLPPYCSEMNLIESQWN